MSFKLTTLGEYARVQGGYAYKSKDFSDVGVCPVLKIKNVRFGHVNYSEASFISEDIANETKDWKTQEGDILISMTGSGPNAPQSLVGRVARVWANEPEAWINQRVGKVVLKDEGSIHPDFLYYLLSSPVSQDYLVSNSSGSANQANISGKIIESLPCPKVDYDESAEIAKILRELDKKIIINRQTNQTLEHMAQAIFKSWFVDFDPTRAKTAAKLNGQSPELAAMTAISGKSLVELNQLNPEQLEKLKNSAALFPETLLDSELGGIPEGWLVNSLSLLLNVRKGLSYKGKHISKNTEDMLMINLGNFGGEGKFRYEKVKYYNGEYKPRHVARKGQLVLANTDMTQDRVILGSPALIPDLGKENVLLTHHTFCVDFHGSYPENDWKLFSYFTFLQPSFRERAEGFATGTTVLALPKDALLKCDVIIPSKNIVIRFNESVSPIFSQINKKIEENRALGEVRDLLLPKLLSGEVDVSSMVIDGVR